MALETVPFDAASYLGDPAAQAELLDDALQSGDASYLREALAVIARARRLKAEDTGASQLSMLLAVARELGVRLRAQEVGAE